MGIKDVFKRLTRKQQPIENTVREIMCMISNQLSEKDRREFMTMIEGMICAGELALAIHSLRTEYSEHDSNEIEIDTQLKKLEEQFSEEIDKLL